MKAPFIEILRSAVDAFFRPHPSVVCIRAGAALVAASVVAFGLRVSFQSDAGLAILDFDNGTSVLNLAGFALGAALAVTGVGWAIVRHRNLAVDRQRARVLVIEQRGLTGVPAQALAEAIPRTVEGRREEVLINIQHLVRGGTVFDPDAALQEVVAGLDHYKRSLRSHHRSDTRTFYGGLIATPIAFTTGFLLDDEGEMSIWDWDRDQSKWRPIEDTDGLENEFEVFNLEGIAEATSDVVLAVGVSYPVDWAAVQDSFGDIPVVRLTAKVAGPHSHWSLQSQRRMAAQFLETLISLKGKSIGRLHLVLAAQNSVAFRLGRAFDRRNLMPTIVYQYEASGVRKHPWGIALPIGPDDRPQICKTLPSARS